MTHHVDHWNFVQELHAPFECGVKEQGAEPNNENPQVKDHKSHWKLRFISVTGTPQGNVHEKEV